MKYRIKKVSNAYGEISYFAQKNFLHFFWINISLYGRANIESAKEDIRWTVDNDLKHTLRKIKKTEYIKYP